MYASTENGIAMLSSVLHSPTKRFSSEVVCIQHNGTDNGYAALTYWVSIKNIQNQRFMKGNEKMINAEYSELEFELWPQAIVNIAED